jgi:perosamine synthetase
MLNYGRQTIDDDDIRAVSEVLRSDWLTTGPKVSEFEDAFAEFTGAKHAVAVNSGTAALHAAMFALKISSGDEVIVPAMTFAASANCVVYQGGTPVFIDVDADTLLIAPEAVESNITKRTKAVVTVDYTGQPCDYDRLRNLCEKHSLSLVADACHALGGAYQGRPVGTLADLSTFSLHPVKPITTGEGGVITANSPVLAQRMRIFRNHGITTDHRQREAKGSWFYEMTELGYNYRITDFQCALGLSQLRKLPEWIKQRQNIAKRYDEAFKNMPGLQPLKVRQGISHGYHLYVVKLELERLKTDRAGIFQALRAEGIGVNVHYVPVHLHPYYRHNYSTRPGLCPVAEAAYERILTLPIFPAMTDRDVEDVITAVEKVVTYYFKD